MKALHLLLLVVLMLGQGCVSSYWVDRGRDAADIITFTVGKGVGVAASAGPICSGIYFGADHIGLRGGEVKYRWIDSSAVGWAYLLDPLILVPYSEGLFFGQEGFLGQDANDYMAEVRKKSFEAEKFVPFVMLPKHERFNGSAPYWTKIEVGIGLWITIRAGFNPGELLDFILGFVGIDIYGDDVGIIKRQKPES